jgi:2-haloacid dehalogenase
MIDRCVIFDVGKVLFDWDLRHLFGKLIADPGELEYFVGNIVTPQWHFQHDAGRPAAEMVTERKAEFPEHAALIDAYGTRFNETIPGPVPGSLELVERLDAAGVPLFAITNFGHDFWEAFRPTQPVFDRFRDVIVSGTEKLMKPDPAIYRLAIARFGIDPAGALFIDDVAKNVAGAESVGIAGHQFVDAETLERELFRRGYFRDEPGFNALMEDCCVGWGWCGGIVDGEPSHVDMFIPESGPVSAYQFVDWLFEAEGVDWTGDPDKWGKHRDGLREVFIRHMKSETVDASALKWDL